MDISQIISDYPIAVTILLLWGLVLLPAYRYKREDEHVIEKKSTYDIRCTVPEKKSTYDIRCTVPGQKEIVLQDIPEDDFDINYEGFVYVITNTYDEYYLPSAYTTILPNT